VTSLDGGADRWYLAAGCLLIGCLRTMLRADRRTRLAAGGLRPLKKDYSENPEIPQLKLRRGA
jgi:hypothetical protein